MSLSPDPMDEDLVLEVDQICNAISDAFDAMDIPDTEHDSVDQVHDIVDADNNTPDFFEHPNTDAENDIIVLDFGHDIAFAEELGTPNFPSHQTMAFTEDTTNLLALADAALGTHNQEEQPPLTVPPQAAFGINTARPAEPPGPSGWALDSARHRGFTPMNPLPLPHQLPLSHQLARHLPLPLTRQLPLPYQLPRQIPLPHQLTRQFPRVLPRTLPQPPPSPMTRPLLQPVLATAPAPPIRNRRQRVNKPQRRQRQRPRTNGFNKETGEGMLTSACGIRTPETKQPVAGGSGKGDYRCPRCDGQFTRSRTVKDHFVSCTKKYGNPQGLHWFDDATLAAKKQWHLDHLPTAKGDEDAEEEEEEEEKNGEEEDEDEDIGLGEMNDD